MKKRNQSKFSKKDSRSERYHRFHAWVDSLPEFEINPKSLKFWRDSLFVFVAAGVIGHLIDLLWRFAMNVPLETWVWQMLPIVALPYGFAALALLWIVYPLFRAKKIGTFLTYVIGGLVTTAVEFICGVTLIAMNHGINPYWDYSHLPFNLYGQVCLINSILFGFVAVAAVCFLLPWFITRINRPHKIALNLVAGLLLACCIASIVLYFIFGFRLVL